MAVSRVGDEVVDDGAGVTTWSGEITPTGTMLSALAMTVPAAIAMTGIEVARRQRIAEIAQIVGEERLDQGEVGAQRDLKQIRLSADLNSLLADLDRSADAGLGQNTAQSIATSANALDERALAGRARPPARRPSSAAAFRH